jgi:hypothetical protein
VTETNNVSALFYKNVKSSFIYMTHTLDSKVSLHSWLLWPTVRRSACLLSALLYEETQYTLKVFVNFFSGFE